MNLIKKLFGVKAPVDLDNDGKIESLRDEISGLFSHFKHMHDKLEKVNTELHNVKVEEQAVVEKAKERITKVETEIESNTKLLDKVKEFIK